jgi:hypothetical protein
MTADSTQQLATLEVMFRPHNERLWQTIRHPSQLTTLASSHSQSQYSLRGQGLSDHSRMGKLVAEILIQTHYAASTDVKYISNALLRYHTDQNTKNIVFEITAKEGPFPELPMDMRGWEGRHPTCLMYTARGGNLKEFLEIVMNQKVQVEPERATLEKNATIEERPAIKLGR